MKLHSDNIRIVPGTPIVLGLNYFPDTEHTIKGLARIMMGAAKKVSGMDLGYMPTGKTRMPIAALTTPMFSDLKDGTYRLERANLWWNGIWFRRGHVFRFPDGENLHVMPRSADGSENTWERVTVLEARVNRLDYDFYRSPKFEVDPRVAHELELPEVFIRKAENRKLVGEWEMSIIKADSVYCPALGDDPAPEGRIFVYQKWKDPWGDGDKDYLEYLTENDRQYDEFLIEFIDKSQPFGYITVEHLVCSDEEMTEEEAEAGIDTNSELWQKENGMSLSEFSRLYALHSEALSIMGFRKSDIPPFPVEKFEEEENEEEGE